MPNSPCFPTLQAKNLHSVANLKFIVPVPCAQKNYAVSKRSVQHHKVQVYRIPCLSVSYMNTDHRKIPPTILAYRRIPAKKKQSFQLQLEPFLPTFSDLAFALATGRYQLRSSPRSSSSPSDTCRHRRKGCRAWVVQTGTINRKYSSFSIR